MPYTPITIIAGILNEISTCSFRRTLLFQTIWEYIAPFMVYLSVWGMSKTTWVVMDVIPSKFLLRVMTPARVTMMAAIRGPVTVLPSLSWYPFCCTRIYGR